MFYIKKQLLTTFTATILLSSCNSKNTLATVMPNRSDYTLSSTVMSLGCSAYAGMCNFNQSGILMFITAHNGAYNHSKSISAYDNLIMRVGLREGQDWRFLSAIAYQESRFNPEIVSHRGAKGLMQIMPVVARHFGYDPDETIKPDINLTIASRLLNEIERSLGFPAGTPEREKKRIVLACYNGGVGHVADARRLARKYGFNPNRWYDVSLFLQLKSEPEYYNDECVRNGQFNGSAQTVGFVNGVMKKFDSYCTNMKYS